MARSRRGFSLIELLAVVAIIAFLFAMVAPAVSSIAGTGSRKGAVITLMNILEQARVAALQSGRKVFVLMDRRQFPEQDRVLVLSDTEDGTGRYQALTKWINLPKGVLLHQPSRGRSMMADDLRIESAPGILDPDRLPEIVDKADRNLLRMAAFSPYGTVLWPRDPSDLLLIVSEGFRGEGGAEATIKNASGQFEIISLRRYTGRASLEVTAL